MTAQEGLYDLISFIGSFITSPLWFGLSVLQLMAIAFIVHFIIGILLGGITPRTSFERSFVSEKKPSENVLNHDVSQRMRSPNEFFSGSKEKYVGGGKY